MGGDRQEMEEGREGGRRGWGGGGGRIKVGGKRGAEEGEWRRKGA